MIVNSDKSLPYPQTLGDFLMLNQGIRGRGFALSYEHEKEREWILKLVGGDASEVRTD